MLIIKSNLIFNGCILNLYAFDSAFIFYSIWESNVNFINQSKFINRKQWEFNLQESKLIVQDSLFDTILMLGYCYFDIISNSLMFVNNSEIIYNNNNHFNSFSTFSISNSNLTISNTLITSSSSKYGSSRIINSDTINPITVSLYNVTISNFIRSSLFSFSIGIIKFEKVKFIECTSSDFFYLSGWYNLYLDLNYINVVTNDYNHIFNIKNTNNNYLPINISNFKTSCSTIEIFSKFISTTTVVSSSPPHEKSTNLLVNSSNTNNNYYHPIQINIRDSSLDCLGSMEFINSNVFFENVDIKASLENFLIYGENSNFVLNSTSYITNNLKNDGKFENSSSHFLRSIESHSKIEKTEFISSYSNFQDFFHLSDSSLDIIMILIDNFNTPDSSLIHLLKSNLSISNSKISNSLFGKRPILFSQDSNCFIDNLIMTNCFCQIEFFQFSSNFKYLFNSFISNSIITDNKGVGINQSPFIVASNVMLKINSCNFMRNLLLPLINSTKSFVTIQDVLYQNNSGSFHFSHYDYRIYVTNFILKDNQIPLSFVFGMINLAYYASFNNIIISNNYLNQYFFFLSEIPRLFSTTSEINNLIFTNNIILNVNDKFPFTLDSSIDYGGVGDDFPISLFIFNETVFSFSSSIFNNNTFNSGLITSFDSEITFSNCTINENLFSKSPNLLYSNSSQIDFKDCNVCSNYAKNQLDFFSLSLIESSGLMNLTYSSLTINSCQFSNNLLNLKSNGNYKLNSYWSLFQVLFIPLFFNSISLLVSKEVDGNHFSALDFTIYYLNDNYLQITLFTLAIIIIVIISLFLIILFLNPIINNIRNFYISRGSSNINSGISSGKSLKLNQPPYQNRIILKFNQFHQLILKLNYKNQFGWLELLVFLKTTIFISLSLSMIFNYKNYLLIIIGIEIFYQSFNFILLQTKKTKKLSRNYQNSLIDLFQLIIFVIVSSSLFSHLDSKTKGNLITCLTFFIILIFIIIKIFNNLIKIK
ncbi:hypothetical protein DDB_G0268930 [Dictyostelium discoideum AX4]|uniref:Uncharacterized protein n=1 Tax=Dictyostelium discoideum TaxID=44689 RepID=Q55F10_DICDI|nr:hypothetical protein DDB_G0268930 [Dictyostelium discoideum AX4]EAL73054.1 hypothetical protein DDB_G0268930 [Dictyostelium discoideum AX4]|eukprot:XP_646860.1 hypothetical protein DDB_G0268930 [Dictyostelium discoideum AX4]